MTADSDVMVAIGRVSAPSGLRGEVRINLYAQDSDNMKEGKVLLLKRAPQSGPKNSEQAPSELRAAVRSVRWQKDRPVIKLEGIDDRNAAEALRGMEVSIAADDLEELPEGEHYVRNLIGCRVVDTAGGGSHFIGTLSDVIQNTAQSILEVKTEDGKSVLIPAVDAFMRNIDEKAGLIEVELIPGFLE